MVAENIDSFEDGFLAFLWDNISPRDRIKVLSDMPKTVWFFGAGASHHYAMNFHSVRIPLANGFFEAFHDLPTSQGFQAHVGPLISYLMHYKGVKPTEASKWKENIEEFMTSIEREVDDLIKQTENKSEHIDVMKATALATTFNNMSFIFANVINEAQNGPSPSAYHELLKFCGPKDTFITLNWDTLLDRALADFGGWGPTDGYGITFSSILDSTWKSDVASSLIIPTEWRLLKLHGSTNWLVPYTGLHPTELKYGAIIPADDKIFLYWQSTLPFGTYRERWRGGYAPTCYGYYPPNLPPAAFSEKSLAAPPGHVFIRMTPINIYSPFKEPSDYGIPSSPLLITPVRQKTYERYLNTIEHLWQMSQKQLASADRLVIIGYSFPPTDTRPLELIRTTLEQKKGEISIEIVDPSASDIAARIGDSHLAKAKQVAIHKLKFEEYLGAQWDYAPSLIKMAAEKYEEVRNWIRMIRAMQVGSEAIYGIGIKR